MELSQSEGSDGGDDCDGFGTANKKLSEKAIELRRRVEERRTERKAALVKAGEMVLYNERRGPVWELSSSIKSKSIRLIFGRIECSRRVLEAEPKSPAQSVQLRTH